MVDPVINPGALAIPVAIFRILGALVPQEPVAVTLTVEPAGIEAGNVMFRLVPVPVIVAPGTFVDQL